MIVAVCCQGADMLALIDVETGENRGRIPVGSNPVHASVIDGRVVIATMGDRAVSVVDLDGSVRSVDTGVLGPSHIAASSDYIYVPCTAGDVVAVLDRAATTLVDRIPVGAEPHEIDIADDVGFVGSRREGCITVFDTTNNAVLGHLSPKGVSKNARVQGVKAVQDTKQTVVYAIDQRNACIARFDLDNERDYQFPRTPIASVSVGADPYEFSIVDDRIYVPGRKDGTISELTRSLEVITKHAVGGIPTAVIGTRRWIVDRETSCFRSLEDDRITVPYPSINAISVDESRYLLSHYDNSAVSLVNTKTQKTEWTTSTPANPFGAVAV